MTIYLCVTWWFEMVRVAGCRRRRGLTMCPGSGTGSGEIVPPGAGGILRGVDHCAECGFVYDTVPAADLPRRLSAAGPRFAAALAAIDDPRRRPAPAVWSPLEYTCHVRDVLRVQGERLALALRTDNPEWVPMGREERVTRDAYNAQEPRVVLAELTKAANDLARLVGSLSPPQWSRTGVYHWPAVETRTLLWLGRHTVHELEHHLLDLARPNGPPS
jgi:hypothetical protein